MHREPKRILFGEGRVILCATVWAWFVITLVALCNVSLLAQTSPWTQTPKRTFPNTTNGVYAYSDQMDIYSWTPAQIQFFATHYVGSQKETTAEAITLRKYNPNFLIMHYRLGNTLGYGSCDENNQPTANNPLYIIDTNWVIEWPYNPQWAWNSNGLMNTFVDPNWFYTYKGSRVYACNYQHYLMNLADPGWRNYYSTQVMKEMTDNQDDAVFADSYSVPDDFEGWWTPNLDYATWYGSGPPNLESEWSGMMHDFTDYMRGRFNGRWLWIPNLGNWVTARDTTDFTNVDGGMIEGFADYGGADFLATSDWKLQMNRCLSLINLHKIMIMQSYPLASGHGTAGPADRLFITGSYLLVKGDHTYLNLDALGMTLAWWPEYSIALGEATDPLPANNNISQFWNAEWGVYVRHYQNGMVLVNPNNAGQGAPPTPIALGNTYYEVTGDIQNDADAVLPANGIPDSGNALTYQAVSSVTVCDDCAAILMNNPPGAP